MDEQRGRDRLAELVKAERRRRYRTITAATAASGVARGTWEKVERGQRVKPFTLDAIEESLGWPQGRAEDILAGAAAPDGDLAEQVRQSNLPDNVKEHILRRLAEDAAASTAAPDEAAG